MNYNKVWELADSACDDCHKCKYFIENDETAYYECEGDKEEKCHEFIIIK